MGNTSRLHGLRSKRRRRRPGILFWPTLQLHPAPPSGSLSCRRLLGRQSSSHEVLKLEEFRGIPAPHALHSKVLTERTALRNVLVVFYVILLSWIMVPCA
jgi:hypothetical protein